MVAAKPAGRSPEQRRLRHRDARVPPRHASDVGGGSWNPAVRNRGGGRPDDQSGSAGQSLARRAGGEAESQSSTGLACQRDFVNTLGSEVGGIAFLVSVIAFKPTVRARFGSDAS